ncbi:MAG TPA: zinc ribbon domain-containing protein [Candidatus Angelobacter sp.]|nr:zinc ribbon domain-containing protein [Candidatus Angelobacter sp.]
MCTFCGTQNRPENRFCGMCGVRMERRQRERRTSKTENLKCASCNHVNEAGHKFCGMCGSRIDRRVKERRGSGIAVDAASREGSGRAVAMANAQLPTPEMENAASGWSRAAAPAPAVLSQMEREEPEDFPRSSRHSNSGIGGPSFLGLNSDTSGDGEYLLEDETSSRSGLRKLVLLVVLLAIAGLIFVQWRATYHAKPPEPPRPGPATVPRPEGKNQTAPGNSEETKNAKSDAPAATNSKTEGDPQANTGEPSNSGTKTKNTSKGTLAAEELKKPATEPEKEVKPVALKPSRENSDVANHAEAGEVQKPSGREKPSLALTKAQRYLQGRGVRQNCEQGMMYLKAATEQDDPNAAVQMAALYASGHCVQQDRVKAYQWFATAYNQEPNNQWIAKNMNQLWSQMTARQRQQFQ